MIKFFILAIIIIFGLSACTEKIDIDQLVSEFSPMQCRAIALKEKRYQLSDHLRSIELDSVAKKKEIDSLQILIDITKNESLRLADSIKLKLNALFTNELLDKKKQVEFTKKLEIFIRDRGCDHQ